VIQLLRRNDIIGVIVLVILGFVLNLKLIIYPPNVEQLLHFHETSFGALGNLKSFYFHYPSLYSFLSVVVLLIFSFVFNYIINREQFYKFKSYLPALALILFTSYFPINVVFSTIHIASALLFISIHNILNLTRTNAPRRSLYNIGIMLAIASYYYFPIVLFVPVCFLIIFLVRSLVLQEIVALLLGFITIIFLFYNIQYIFNNATPSVLHITKGIYLPVKGLKNIHTIIGVLITMYAICTSFILIQRPANYPIQIKKKWTAVSVYMIIAILVGMLSAFFIGISWIVAILPISIILSMCFQHRIEKYNNFTLSILIILILTVQWFVH
jgi:hypothetical protein